MAGINLSSFRDLLGRVNDGQFIVQTGDDGRQTLDRVNRGQYALTRKLRWRQMELNDGNANKLTRETLLNAIVADKQINADAAVNKLREELGLNSEDTQFTALDVRTVKDLLDRIDEGELDLNADANSSGEYDRMVNGQLGGNEQQLPVDEQEIPEEELADKIEERESTEEAPHQPENQGDSKEQLHEVEQSDTKRFIGAQTLEEAQRLSEKIQEAHDKQLRELKEEIDETSAKVKDELMTKGGELIKELRKEIQGGKLRFYAEGIGEGDGEQDELVEVDGIAQYILQLSLSANTEDYYAEAVWRMVGDRLDAFSSMEEQAFIPGQGENTGARDIQALQRTLAGLKEEFSHAEIKQQISSRLQAMLKAVQSACAAKYDFGDNEQLAKAMRAQELPSDNDFYVRPGYAFANYQMRVGVGAMLRDYLASTIDRFNQEYGVATEDPRLIDDLKKLVEERGQSLRELTSGELDGPLFDKFELLRRFEGLKQAVEAAFSQRLALCKQRRAVRIEVMEKTGIGTRLGEIMKTYNGRLSSAAMERLANFVSAPPPPVRALIDEAIRDQLEKHNLGASDVGVKVRNAFEETVEAVLADERAQAKSRLAELQDEFRALADGYLTAGHAEAFGALDGLRPLNDVKAEDEVGLEHGPATQRLATIQEKAFEYAFAKVGDKGFLPADFESDKGNAEIRKTFRREYQAAFFRMHHLMEFYDECVKDAHFQSSVKSTGMKHFQARVYLNADEQKVVNACLGEVRMKFVLHGAAEEKGITLESGVQEDFRSTFENRLLELLAAELELKK